MNLTIPGTNSLPLAPDCYIPSRYHFQAATFCRAIRFTKTTVTVEKLKQEEDGSWRVSVSPNNEMTFNLPFKGWTPDGAVRNKEAWLSERGGSHSRDSLSFNIAQGLANEAERIQEKALAARFEPVKAALDKLLKGQFNGNGRFCGSEDVVLVLEETVAKLAAIKAKEDEAFYVRNPDCRPQA